MNLKRGNNLKYSSWNYLFRLSSGFFVSIILFFILKDDSSPFFSLLFSSFAFFLILLYLSFILLKERKWMNFFSIAFIVKLLIGIFHYLIYLDPNYFSGSGILMNPKLQREYHVVYDRVISLAHLKKINGIFFYDFKLQLLYAHSEILSFISIPFVFFGDYILTITPINAFYTLLTSINIIIISKYVLNISDKKLKVIAILTAYFPMGLIASYFTRDLVGQSLMSSGIVLIMLSTSKLSKFLTTTIAGFLFFLQRTVYPIAIVISFVLSELFYNKKAISLNRKVFNVFIVSVLSIILYLLINKFSEFIWNDAANDMLLGQESTNGLALLLRSISLLMGGAWHLLSRANKQPEYSYMYTDIFSGIFNYFLIFSAMLSYKEIFKSENINLLNITGLTILLIGFSARFSHTPYVSIAMIFLIPWIISVTTLNIQKNSFFLAIAFCSLINLIGILLSGGWGLL